MVGPRIASPDFEIAFRNVTLRNYCRNQATRIGSPGVFINVKKKPNSACYGQDPVFELASWSSSLNALTRASLLTLATSDTYACVHELLAGIENIYPTSEGPVLH